MKIMTSGPITSWQTDGEKVERASNFIFLGTRITVDNACRHEMVAPWKCLLLGKKKNYDKPRQGIKVQGHHFVDKGPHSQTMVFPVVMYGCESWTIKKAESPRIDSFKLWCWRRLLRVPWTARRLNQSNLKEINPEYSLNVLC